MTDFSFILTMLKFDLRKGNYTDTTQLQVLSNKDREIIQVVIMQQGYIP
jgi:hypothetical protein